MASREKKLAKNTIMLIVGKALTQCLGFFMLPLYTSLLSTQDYGTAELILTYVSLLTPIISLQLEQGLFRMLLDYREKRERQTSIFSLVFVTNIIQLMLFSVLFVVLLCFVQSPYISYLLPIIILQIIQNTLLQFSRGIDRTSHYTIASFFYAFVHVGMNAILIGVFRIGVIGLFLSIIAASIVVIVYLTLVLRLWRYFSLKKIDWIEIKELLKYSLPLIPNQIAWWIISASDRVIISFCLGNSANGIYSVANKFSAIYITFYNFFNMSWTESVSLAMKDKDKEHYVDKMINTFFELLLSVCLIIVSIMPFIFDMLIGPAYKDAFYHIPILMLAVFFQALQGLYSALYVALKKTKEIAKTSMGSAIINILVNLVLIKWIGLYAASVSTLISFVVMSVYRYIHVRRYLSFSIRTYKFVVGALMIVLSFAFYYSNNVLFQGVGLVIIVVYSILSNRKFICDCLRSIKRILFKSK